MHTWPLLRRQNRAFSSACSCGVRSPCALHTSKWAAGRRGQPAVSAGCSTGRQATGCGGTSTAGTSTAGTSTARADRLHSKALRHLSHPRACSRERRTTYMYAERGPQTTKPHKPSHHNHHHLDPAHPSACSRDRRASYMMSAAATLMLKLSTKPAMGTTAHLAYWQGKLLKLLLTLIVFLSN